MVKAALILFWSIWLAGCSLHEQTAMPAEVNTAVLPALHIQPAVLDLGDIPEGKTVRASFIIRNNTNQTIELTDIQASCGCTVAAPDSYVIAPGTFTRLQVSVDTTAKQQHIKKTVYIRDSLGHQAVAKLTFNVVANPHASPGKPKGIFDGECASCHFEPLLGVRAPAKLFAVGCAMCHGKDGTGGYAPALKHYPSLQALKHIIRQGVGKPQMPGFSQENGGPLTEEQIDSLARWLAAKTEH